MIQESWDVLGCPGCLCSAACGALRIGGLVMCFLNPPKLAMDEASDGANQQASWPHGPCHKAWFILVLWLLAKEYKHFAQLVGNTTLEPMVRGAIDRAIAKAWSFICSAVTH